MQRSLFALSLGFAGVILATHEGWSLPAAARPPVNPLPYEAAGNRGPDFLFRQALAHLPPPAPQAAPGG